MLLLPLLSILLLHMSSCLAKPNVLFIVSDDLRPNLGVYADVNQGVVEAPQMHTPNLDKLGRRSMVFESAYVQNALCNPSRTSFLTSRRPDTTHVNNLETYFRESGGNFTTIPQFFKEKDYTSISVGKIFHRSAAASGPGANDAISWSETFNAKWSDIYRGGNLSWEAVTEEQKPLVDTAEADWVIQRLGELAPAALLGEEQFFLGWGLHRPHLPFVFPQRFLDFYPEVNLPSNPFAPSDMPERAWYSGACLRSYQDCTRDALDLPDLGEVNVTLPDWKTIELRRAYYASVSHADNEIGRVLGALGDLGLAETTIVVFLGDHGWQLGEHCEWCKKTNFEVAAHAPLILHVPGLTDQGLRSSQLVEFVDIFPTLVDAAGFNPLEPCPEISNTTLLCTEGSSLIPLLENPNESVWKKAVFWQYPRGDFINTHLQKIMGYSMRTAEWHYTEWVGVTHLGGADYQPDWENQRDWPELYNLIDDPQENWNLARQSDYSQVLQELSSQLRAGWRLAKPESNQ